MTQQDYELQRSANRLVLSSARAGGARADIEQLGEIASQLACALPGGAERAPSPASLEPSDRGAMMGGDTTRLEVTITVRMRQIPSSMVHVLDPEATPLITCEIKNHRSKTARIKILARVEQFSADSIETLEIKAHTTCTRSLLPVFFLDRLAEVTETRAACIYLRVDDLDGRTEHEHTYRTVLLPRTTAYLEVRDSAGAVVDLTPYLGAWVTPNAAEVMQLVREAADLTPEGVLVGYQGKAEAMPSIVEAQVEAIYRAIQARHLTYVNSVIAFNLAGSTFTQRIRLPRESLANRSANCIDGVVLMASALEAASLNPAIVVIPGHAFLAYESISYSGNWDFVETTLLGTASFADAQRAGRATAQSFGNRTSSRMKILSIPKLRFERGIFPME